MKNPRTKIHMAHILVSLVLLLGCAAFFIRYEAAVCKTDGLDCLRAETDGQSLSLWYDETAGTRTLFLPAHAAGKPLSLTGWPRGSTLWLDGAPYEAGTEFCPGECHTLRLENGRQRTVGENALQIQPSSHIPALYLELPPEDLKAVHANKQNEAAVSVSLVLADGQVDFTGSGILRGRGNTTWELSDKKPYRLTFTAPTPLLGMDSASQWVLLANALDASHLRNRLALDMAREAGLPHAVDCEYAELYLNGEYRGLYLLCQPVTVPPHLPLLERDGRLEPGSAATILVGSQVFRAHSTGDYTMEELGSLLGRWDRSITAGDPVALDMDSFVMVSLLDEIAKDPDGAKLSAFYYIQDETLFSGPVWDFDLAFGRTGNAHARQPAGMTYCYNGWYRSLYALESFHTSMAETYDRVFRPMLAQFCSRPPEAIAPGIAAAAARDQQRWHTAEPAEAMTALQDWLSRRMAFLDDVLLEGVTYHTVTVDKNDALQYYFVENGTPLSARADPSLPASLSTAEGTPYDIDAPVTGDIRLTAVSGDSAAGFRLPPVGILACMALFALLCLATALLLAAELLRGRRFQRKGEGKP